MNVPPVGSMVTVCYADGDHAVRKSAVLVGSTPTGLVVRVGFAPEQTIHYAGPAWVEDSQGRPIHPDTEVIGGVPPELE